jgi:hypothetical protein
MKAKKPILLKNIGYPPMPNKQGFCSISRKTGLYGG